MADGRFQGSLLQNPHWAEGVAGSSGWPWRGVGQAVQDCTSLSGLGCPTGYLQTGLRLPDETSGLHGGSQSLLETSPCVPLVVLPQDCCQGTHWPPQNVGSSQSEVRPRKKEPSLL